MHICVTIMWAESVRDSQFYGTPRDRILRNHIVEEPAVRRLQNT